MGPMNIPTAKYLIAAMQASFNVAESLGMFRKPPPKVPAGYAKALEKQKALKEMELSS